MKPFISNFIGGETVAPASKAYIDNFDPSVGKVYSGVPDSDERDVNQAVEAAKRAFPEWSRRPTQERAQVLRNLANLIEKNLDALLARSPSTAANPFPWPPPWTFRGALKLRVLRRRHHPVLQRVPRDRRAGSMNYTLRSPLGVVACISPWNLPLYLSDLENRARARDGKLRGRQAVGSHADDRVPALADRARGWAAAGRAQHRSRPRAQGGRCAPQHPDDHGHLLHGQHADGREIARVAAPALRSSRSRWVGRTPRRLRRLRFRRRRLRPPCGPRFQTRGRSASADRASSFEHPIYERFKQPLLARARALKRRRSARSLRLDQGAVVSPRALTTRSWHCLEPRERKAARSSAAGTRLESPDAARRAGSSSPR